jgi:hypothetical protein
LNQSRREATVSSAKRRPGIHIIIRIHMANCYFLVKMQCPQLCVQRILYGYIILAEVGNWLKLFWNGKILFTMTWDLALVQIWLQCVSPKFMCCMRGHVGSVEHLRGDASYGSKVSSHGTPCLSPWQVIVVKRTGLASCSSLAPHLEMCCPWPWDLARQHYAVWTFSLQNCQTNKLSFSIELAFLGYFVIASRLIQMLKMLNSSLGKETSKRMLWQPIVTCLAA